MNHAFFSTHKIENLVIVIDLDPVEGRRSPCKSVTNDAEWVVQKLIKDGVLDPEKDVLIYRDTIGRWDQMVVIKGRFSTFRALSNPPEEPKKRAFTLHGDHD